MLDALRRLLSLSNKQLALKRAPARVARAPKVLRPRAKASVLRVPKVKANVLRVPRAKA